MNKANFPVLPLRDIVVFPGMVAPLFVGRTQSVNALNHAMTSDKKIFLLAQKNSEIDNPKKSDLYEWGTIAKVLQLLKLPDGTIKVLVEGITRARLNTLNLSNDFLTAKINKIDTKQIKGPHIHKNRTSYFYCIDGEIIIIVKDKEGKFHELKGDSERPKLIEVSNDIPAAIVNPTANISTVLVLADIAWKPDDNEMENVTFEDYDWGKWK